MLRSVKEIMACSLESKSGEIGKSKDLLFDDDKWVIRYLVADTGKWLLGRQILISPISLKGIDWDTQQLPVDLSKEQIESAPSIETDMPVSRQFEIELSKHNNWPYYWTGEQAMGAMLTPGGAYPTIFDKDKSEADVKRDKHLRSVNEVTGYHLLAEDGEIGHVEDFIVDDEAWAIRYIVVNTRNWLPGKKVLVSPFWSKTIDWAERKILFGVTMEQIKNSPEYDPTKSITPDYEDLLFDYYGILKDI